MTDDGISEIDPEVCFACGVRSWNVRFRWDPTSAEQYCHECLLEPIEGQPRKVFLDYLPECQDVTHRITSPAGDVIAGPVRYGSVRALYPLLTSKLR
jgi:hypothetical protein